MIRRNTILILLSGIICSFTLHEFFEFPVPKNWPNPLYDFNKNPLDSNKIELGRALFYDPILSRNNTISCASCHNQYTAFAHVDHDLSHGINNQIGTRNAPALMNLAWQKSFMWDGAVHHLDVQALNPIESSIEMDESLTNVIYKLQHSKTYPKLFQKAFKDSIITGERTLLSISQFLLTLLSANSKYDKMLRAELKYTTQELNGYRLFKANCESCHSEPLFTNGSFENNGLAIDTSLNDIGRMKVTMNKDDAQKFKVPTLRNIEFSYPYMHDGRFNKLKEVLNHYTSSIKKSSTLSEKLRTPIVLTDNEKIDLLSFLLTLSDQEFLFNQNFSYPHHILKYP